MRLGRVWLFGIYRNGPTPFIWCWLGRSWVSAEEEEQEEAVHGARQEGGGGGRKRTTGGNRKEAGAVGKELWGKQRGNPTKRPYTSVSLLSASNSVTSSPTNFYRFSSLFSPNICFRFFSELWFVFFFRISYWLGRHFPTSDNRIDALTNRN